MPDKTKSPKSGAVELTAEELSAEELDQVTGGTLDGSSKEPAYMTIKFEPERVRSTSTNALKKE